MRECRQHELYQLNRLTNRDKRNHQDIQLPLTLVSVLSVVSAPSKAEKSCFHKISGSTASYRVLAVVIN